MPIRKRIGIHSRRTPNPDGTSDGRLGAFSQCTRTALVILKSPPLRPKAPCIPPNHQRFLHANNSRVRLGKEIVWSGHSCPLC